MSDKTYDLVIIGGGPGGYVASLRAAQLGLVTACIDRRATLGGTCLNVGCIPSKALLHSSERYAALAHDGHEHGIRVDGLSLDLEAMMSRKRQVVEDLGKGIEFLLDKNKVDRFTGTAIVPEAGRVEIALQDGAHETLTTKNIVIATGSEPVSLPGIEIDAPAYLLLEDAERGVLWVGTSRGVAAARGDEVRWIGPADGLVGAEVEGLGRLDRVFQILFRLGHFHTAATAA